MELLLSVDPLLHAGHEHPATLWIAVSAVISFVLGVGVGAFGTGSTGTSRFGAESAADTNPGVDGDEE